MISNFSDGMRVEGQFLVGSASKSVNNLGGQYLTIELRDASGSISSKKWDVLPEDEKIFVPGNVVLVTGEVVKYREALQFKILKASLVEPDDIDFASLLTPPPIPKEELVKKFYGFVEGIKDQDCRKLLDYFIGKYKGQIFDYPAASSIHHEYMSGLLVHCTTMAEIAEKLCSIYPVNKDLVITSVLLHDFGKITELEGPIVYKYSVKGKLIGHISIMAAEIENAAKELGLTSETPLLLQHAILSHHGQLEYGSPVLPETAEALMLSLVDNLDSKMVITLKALEETKEGEFTNKVYPLDGRTFYKHK